MGKLVLDAFSSLRDSVHVFSLELARVKGCILMLAKVILVPETTLNISKETG